MGRVGLLAATMNALAISLFVWLEPVISFTFAPKWLVITLALATFAGGLVLSHVVGGRLAVVTANANVVVASAIFALALLELAFLAVPSVFPDNLRVMIASSNLPARKAIVERLPHSPFAKPFANRLVRIPGYYGPKDTFAYEWLSDRRGFKNLPQIAALDEFKVVALGDSYTEGMGVATEDTWTSRLAQKGHPAYSLGIQGYAPTQFLGAYEHYGRRLSPEWVIVGILGGVHERERYFVGSESAMAHRWTKIPGQQAIGRLVHQDEVNEARPVYMETREGYRVALALSHHHRFLTTAIVTLAINQVDFARHFDIKHGVADAGNDVRFIEDKELKRSAEAALPLMARYRQEIAIAAYPLSGKLPENPQWQQMERVLSAIADRARSDGDKVLLLYFPNRGAAYYRKATGRPLPHESMELVQARTLKDFADRQGMPLIDFLPVFEQEVEKLTENDGINAYPYLKIDGHPSPVGHEIIAASIARFFEQEQNVGDARE